MYLAVGFVWLLLPYWPMVSSKDETGRPFQVIVHNDKTMAHLIFGSAGRQLIFCELFDLEKPNIKLPLESMAIRPPMTVHYRTMLDAVRRCSDLAWSKFNNTIVMNATEISGGNVTATNSSVEAITTLPNNITTVSITPTAISVDTNRLEWNDTAVFWRGIVPGTKWCGLGDVAQNYEDLGHRLDIDLCCRAHDHCPVRLRAFRTGYGIFNFSFYSRLYCECDQDFYQCLKRSNSSSASMLGHLYFNVLRIHCLKEESSVQQQCISYRNTTRCPDPGLKPPAFDARMKVIPFGIAF